ncbi:MAG: HAMP domain-containing histidine kinase, partial [Deltaproteobacteria bacterium]|nr:HAMP domain-containing histidine kinase [Deltaproteobacteria bacterium]
MKSWIIKHIRELTIFKRLALGYLAILLLVIALGIYTTLRLDQLNQITHSISSIDGETIRIANRLRNNSFSQSGFEEKYIVSRDKDFYHQFLEIEKHIKTDLKRISTLIDTPEKKRLISDIKKLHSQYLSIVQNPVYPIKIDKKHPQKRAQEEKKKLISKTTNKLEQVIEIAKADVGKKIKRSGEISDRASKVTASISTTAIIMGILIAFFNARTINYPVLRLIKGTRETAKGEFEKHITIPSPPEIKELANAFNLMRDHLKKIDEIKADLFSSISHDLRTPLAVIRESASLLFSEDETTRFSEKEFKLISIIGEECERLIKSVNTILDISRMDAGMTDYNMEKYNLSLLIEKSLSSIKPIAESSGIDLEVKITDRLPPVNIDGERIAQAFDNLLDNAMKFTAQGGKVTVAATLKEVDTLKHLLNNKKKFVEVSVSDTGCGIPEENIEEIFDKFKMLRGKGTGLGLYIARHIINAHGGEIWVKSKQ